MAWLLKYTFDQDALACGIDKNAPETLSMLAEWADHILYAEPALVEHIPESYRQKAHVIDVGPDTWGLAGHPDLMDLIVYLLMKSDFLDVLKIAAPEVVEEILALKLEDPRTKTDSPQPPGEKP